MSTRLLAAEAEEARLRRGLVMALTPLAGGNASLDRGDVLTATGPGRLTAGLALDWLTHRDPPLGTD